MVEHLHSNYKDLGLIPSPEIKLFYWIQFLIYLYLMRIIFLIFDMGKQFFILLTLFCNTFFLSLPIDSLSWFLNPWTIASYNLKQHYFKRWQSQWWLKQPLLLEASGKACNMHYPCHQVGGILSTPLPASRFISVTLGAGEGTQLWPLQFTLLGLRHREGPGSCRVRGAGFGSLTCTLSTHSEPWQARTVSKTGLQRELWQLQQWAPLHDKAL